MRSISSETLVVKHLAERLLIRCVEAERRFIAGFWLDPTMGHDAAVDAPLSTHSFSDRRLGLVFYYLCRCVETDTKHTIDGCLFVADRCEPGMIPECDYDWVYRLILHTDTEAGCVGHYADRVRQLADIRDHRARTALAEYARLASGDGFTITVTPKRNTIIRGPRKRGSRKHGCTRIAV